VGKTLREILEETGEYHGPLIHQTETPEWEEPKTPDAKWMTLGELIGLIGPRSTTLYNATLSLVFLCFWILVVLMMASAFVGGCQ